MALPANTAYVDEVPRLTVAVAATADWVPRAAKVMNEMPVTNMVEKESRKGSGTVPCLGPRRARVSVFREEGEFEGRAEVDIYVLPKVRHDAPVGSDKTTSLNKYYVRPA